MRAKIYLSKAAFCMSNGFTVPHGLQYSSARCFACLLSSSYYFLTGTGNAEKGDGRIREAENGRIKSITRIQSRRTKETQVSPKILNHKNHNYNNNNIFVLIFNLTCHRMIQI